MSHNREDDFLAGLALLTPFFEEQGYELQVYPPYAAEEGTYYFARFFWGNHSVTLVHADGLERVTYTVGGMSIEHEAYLDALAVRMGSSFPADSGSDDPLAGYRGLLGDLETRITPFFEFPEREFMEFAATHGRRGLPWLPTA